jgi:hypothetical protein
MRAEHEHYRFLTAIPDIFSESEPYRKGPPRQSQPFLLRYRMRSNSIPSHPWSRHAPFG